MTSHRPEGGEGEPVSDDASDAVPPDPVNRREFLNATTSVAMAAGLVGGYGTFAVIAGRFLYSQEDSRSWQFLATVADFAVGQSHTYTSPDGAKVVVARQSKGDSAEAFIALSSVCPHLGCQVHWEGHRDRFFCPCHNGAFDRQGQATEGPPAAAGQQLKRFPLMVENGMLFIEVASQTIARASNDSPLTKEGPFA